MGDATLGLAARGGTRGFVDRQKQDLRDLTGLCQFTKVRIRSGNRQNQDLPDFRI